MNFKETSISQDYSTTLRGKEMDWNPDNSYRIYDTLMVAISEFLGTMKSKEEKTVAIVITDLKGNFKMSATVGYHENEENKDMPGNWSYTMSFDADSIKEVGKVYQSNDTQFQIFLTNAAYDLHGMQFMSPSYINDMIVAAVDTLTNWLDVNAKEGEKTSITLDGFFVASVEVIDDKKVMAIVPDGAMKKLIKSDKDQ